MESHAIISKLAISLGDKSQNPNIELAKEICKDKNTKAVAELVEHLNHSDKNIQSDCIKTLYEVGYLQPSLIAPYVTEFITLLNQKNNRLVWGGMIALSCIAQTKPAALFKHLDVILNTMNKGSVITNDAGIIILAQLNTQPQYTETIDPILHDQLWKCPIKQLPMYIENSLKSITVKNKDAYAILLERRMQECEKESQLKRLQKAMKKIQAI